MLGTRDTAQSKNTTFWSQTHYFWKKESLIKKITNKSQRITDVVIVSILLHSKEKD